MKKVLITGVARGLGKALKEHLLAEGNYVYGTRRDGKNDQGNNFRDLTLDLEDDQSIDELIEFFKDIELDAVIHNSGIAYKDPAYVMSDDERKKIFQVNFFGPCRLSEGLIPKFQKRGGRFIFISSIVSVDPWPHLGVYAASKAAMDRVAFEWSALLKKWNIETCVVRPNPVPTDAIILRSKNADPNVDEFKSELVWESVEDTLDVISEALNAKAPKFEYYTGQSSQASADAIVYPGSVEKRRDHFRELYS